MSKKKKFKKEYKKLKKVLKERNMKTIPLYHPLLTNNTKDKTDKNNGVDPKIIESFENKGWIPLEDIIRTLLIKDIKEDTEKVKHDPDAIKEDDGVAVDVLFTIKNVMYSGNKTIVFWTDNTKTIVTMCDEEDKFDPEKAIYAAYTKKIISFLNMPSRQRSLDKLFKPWIDKFNDNKEEYIADVKRALNKKTKKAKEKKVDQYAAVTEGLNTIIKDLNDIEEESKNE